MSSAPQSIQSITSEPISIEAVAELMASMSRLLTRLSMSRPFREADLGVAEWLGLMTIQSKEGLGNKQFAKLLGITGQRATQITEALKRAGLIDVVVAPDDLRARSMSITPAGVSTLEGLNGTVLPLLAESLKGRERVIARTQKGVLALTRFVREMAIEGDRKG
jgi:DNA-binding MarR family transcriptional regulator